MGKLVHALVVGLIGAAIVHIAILLAMPRVAERDAWGRLSGIGGLGDVVRIDPLRSRGSGDTASAEVSGSHDFAFVDPAFATVSCRFTLENGPVHILADDTTPFWTASIYSRQGDNLYSINDRSAVRGTFDLMVGTPEQLLEAKANSADREETSIPVQINASEGYLTLRALVDGMSQRPSVEAFARSVRCVIPQPPDSDEP